jgi:hypothetical protein
MAAARCFGDGVERLRNSVVMPPTGLSDRIVEDVLADGPRIRRFFWLAPAMAAAAGILALIWFGRPRPVEDISNRTIASSAAAHPELIPPPVEVVPPVVATNALRQSLSEAGLVFAALSKRAADETIEPTRVLVPSAVVPSSFTVNATPKFDPATSVLSPMGQGIVEGFEPVATTARRAFDFFYRELPRPPAEPARKPNT